MQWFQLIRIHQWPKNFFVFAGLIFAQKLQDPTAVLTSVEAFFLFCFTSSLVYIANDLMDLESDRHHPRKKERPLASGAISPAMARITLLIALPLVLGTVLVRQPDLLPIIAIYLLINAAYSLGLKQFPLLDIFLIATGFVLRVLAGTIAIQVPLSNWALLCTGSLALFLAAAKRRMDFPDGHQASLRGYTPAFLDQILTLAASLSILFYGLYCSEGIHAPQGRPSMIWTLPFVAFGILHYLRAIHDHLGSGRSLILDRGLLITIAGWLALSIWILH
jgi:decaprenyl-phosphate phosphoribosyltransferase